MPLYDIDAAVRRIIDRLYASSPSPATTPLSERTRRKTERNNEIRALYANGESIAALAKRLGLSEQRVHQIIHSTHE